MAEPTDSDLQALQAQMAELRQSLASLERLAQQGLPVSTAQAEAQQRLAEIEARWTGARAAAIDQRRQHVDTQINIAHLYQVYQSAPGRATMTEDTFRKVLDDYVGWVKREYGYTRLHGLQSLQRTGALDRPLAQVYTSLAVRHRPAVLPGGEWIHARRKGQEDVVEPGMRGEPQPMDMAELLTLGERIAIVGGAGSGKTTYLAFVAATLAAALRGEALDVRLMPPAPAERAPLPVPLLAPLRFWSVYRGECSKVPGLLVTHGPDEGSLGAFLRWFLRSRYKNFDAAGDFFDRLLRGGRGCLILLDGLDEVVSVDERQLVRDEVERLLTSQYPGNRCLVTAREAGYRDAPFGSEFIRCDVQPMSEEQIAALVGAWCGQIYPQPGDCDAAGRELVDAINRLNADRTERGQGPLVATPLMVTMVVSVKYSRRELPRERAKLYDACVDVVLSSEYTGREDDAGARRGVVYSGGPPDKQREWLSRLAFQMHQGGQAGASLDEAGVRAILEPVFRQRGEEGLLEPFLNAIRHRGSLLEERGDRFQFMHLTFQEYLAAQFLARQWKEQPRGYMAGVVLDDWWREALLLTVGSLGAPVPYEPRHAFIAAMCGLQAPFPARLAAAELAAAGLGDLSEPEPTLRDMAQQRLLALLTDPALAQAPPALRARAGDALAVLGDTRNFDELITIPAGPFLMGSTDADEMASDDERPHHTVTLPTFKIAKYPVTNAQYLRFTQATGRAWSSDDGQRADRSNHPAVYVSWYDARAYCDWLTQVWRDEGKIAADEVVRLPTEAEWEKAARGPSTGSGDGRIYPWGNEWDETKCNAEETGLGRTCAVGLFPDGAGPYGCRDMAGNVWEWTGSLWGKDVMKPDFKYPYNPKNGRENLEAGGNIRRVLRGGAFDDRDFVRCAVRYRNFPFSGWYYFGFRVLVSPISPTSALWHSAL